MKVHDPGDIRENNIRRVVEIIREMGAISRADIARETQLSRSTITNIVNDLLPTGLVEETGTGNSYVGRRPIMLEFDYGARLVLGVDMGATHLTIVAANLAGEVLALRHETLAVSSHPDRTIERIVTLTNEVREEAGYTLAHTLGLGIAVPAPLEGDSFDRISPIILPKWMGVDLRREIAAATHLPVFLDNDANLGALAEKWWGHGREVSNLAYIKVATGVGCGLIINGAIFRGEGGTAGEIGHIAIQADGPPCRCGLRGCLEAMTGTQAIEQRIAQALAAGRGQHAGGHPLPPRDRAGSDPGRPARHRDHYRCGALPGHRARQLDQPRQSRFNRAGRRADRGERPAADPPSPKRAHAHLLQIGG